LENVKKQFMETKKAKKILAAAQEQKNLTSSEPRAMDRSEETPLPLPDEVLEVLLSFLQFPRWSIMLLADDGDKSFSAEERCTAWDHASLKARRRLLARGSVASDFIEGLCGMVKGLRCCSSFMEEDPRAFQIIADIIIPPFKYHESTNMKILRYGEITARIRKTIEEVSIWRNGAGSPNVWRKDADGMMMLYDDGMKMVADWWRNRSAMASADALRAALASENHCDIQMRFYDIRGNLRGWRCGVLRTWQDSRWH
jgi:hypothetical protein